MRSLEGQTALVTGGGKGIGRAIALALAARGARIVITGREERALGETVGEIANAGAKARHVAGDVRDPAHLDRAVARAIEVFGRLDIVIANAGVSGRVALGSDLARAEAILATNVMGAYYTFHAAVPRMHGPGRLLATSSVLANRGVAGHAAYCASKAALLGLCRAVAHEVAPKKITCNALVPGWVEGDLAEAGLRELAEATGKSVGDVKRDEIAGIPLGRFVTAEEIAQLVVYLCGPGASAITGQAVAI
jgi:NAD(P)-dependent dehydrogenase (short-subunit alcohol dehydrogenase family)